MNELDVVKDALVVGLDKVNATLMFLEYVKNSNDGVLSEGMERDFEILHQEADLFYKATRTVAEVQDKLDMYQEELADKHKRIKRMEFHLDKILLERDELARPAPGKDTVIDNMSRVNSELRADIKNLGRVLEDVKKQRDELSEQVIFHKHRAMVEEAEAVRLGRERDELKESLEFAATYKGVEGRSCPLCTYEDGVFVEMCQMHKDIAKLEHALWSEPLDTPDSPGWWAFEGGWKHNPSQQFKYIFEVSEHDGSLTATVVHDITLFSELDGKWWKLVLPWGRKNSDE